MYVKRSELSLAKLVVIGVASFFAVVYVSINELFLSDIIETSAEINFPEQIVLDAGHGGMDGGAVGIHSEQEKDINLAITKKVKTLFILSGYDVVMTRNDDVSIHDKSCKDLSTKKRSDIQNRLKIISKNPKVIAVSIHQNKFKDEEQQGAQMFYGKINPESDRLAQCLQNAFVRNLQPDNIRAIKEGTSSVYLLKHAPVPFVLVECGFISNDKEATLLSSKEYQDKVAFTIYSGIMEYLAGECEEVEGEG